MCNPTIYVLYPHCLYALQKLTHAINRAFLSFKIENFQLKKFDIFLIFAQNIDCGYTLEPPRKDGFNEYPQSMYWIKSKKNRYTPPYRNEVQNRHKILYLFCTIYVPFHFRHKIGIPILYQSENLEILHVPFMCLCGLRHFCLYLFCAFQDLVIFSCAYFIPSSDLVIF